MTSFPLIQASSYWGQVMNVYPQLRSQDEKVLALFPPGSSVRLLLVTHMPILLLKFQPYNMLAQLTLVIFCLGFSALPWLHLSYEPLGFHYPQDPGFWKQPPTSLSKPNTFTSLEFLYVTWSSHILIRWWGICDLTYITQPCAGIQYVRCLWLPF